MPFFDEDVPTFADAPIHNIRILPFPGRTELARRSGPRVRGELHDTGHDLIAAGLNFAAHGVPRGTT